MRVIAEINTSTPPKEAIKIAESYGIKNSTNLVSDAPQNSYFAIFNTDSKTVAFFNKINDEKTASYVNVTGSKCSSSGLAILCAIICDQIKLMRIGSMNEKDQLMWSMRKSDKTDYSIFKGKYDLRAIYQLQRTNYLSDEVSGEAELYDIGVITFLAKPGGNGSWFIDNEANVSWTLFKTNHVKDLLGCSIDECVKHLKNVIPFEQINVGAPSSELRRNLSMITNGHNMFGIVILRGKNGIVYADLGAFLQSIDLNYKMFQLTIRRMTTNLFGFSGRKSTISSPLSFSPGYVASGNSFNLLLLQGPPVKK